MIQEMYSLVEKFLAEIESIKLLGEPTRGIFDYILNSVKTFFHSLGEEMYYNEKLNFPQGHYRNGDDVGVWNLGLTSFTF